MSPLSQRLIDRGTHVASPDGNGVILACLLKPLTDEERAAGGEFPIVDDAGFPLHHGNPVWMD